MILYIFIYIFNILLSFVKIKKKINGKKMILSITQKTDVNTLTN